MIFSSMFFWHFIISNMFLLTTKHNLRWQPRSGEMSKHFESYAKSYASLVPVPLQWRHNERDGVSNHRRIDRLLNRFKRRSNDTSKLCVTSLCEGNPPVNGGFPAKRASNAETAFIWWRRKFLFFFNDNSSAAENGCCCPYKVGISCVDPSKQNIYIA